MAALQRLVAMFGETGGANICDANEILRGRRVPGDNGRVFRFAS
jgi:hypothetical protein